MFWIGLGVLAVVTAIWPNMRIACVTLIVLILVPATGSGFDRPVDRVIEIFLGVVASLLVSALVRGTMVTASLDDA